MNGYFQHAVKSKMNILLYFFLLCFCHAIAPLSFAWTNSYNFRIPTRLRSERTTTSSSIIFPNENDATNLVGSWSDKQFQVWIHEQLQEEAGPVLYEKYGEQVFDKLSKCITLWRKRYRDGDSAKLWKRLFKRDRVVKEIIESLPIIHAIDGWVASASNDDEPVTIIDLCSGKGYLSMLLSEYLPASRVKKCILIDKAWPMCFSEPQPHHIR